MRSTAITAMTQRMDMVVSVTRLLLDNSTFSEAVTLQRCARLLAGDLADWVIVDMERDEQGCAGRSRPGRGTGRQMPWPARGAQRQSRCGVAAFAGA